MTLFSDGNLYVIMMMVMMIMMFSNTTLFCVFPLLSQLSVYLLTSCQYVCMYITSDHIMPRHLALSGVRSHHLITSPPHRHEGGLSAVELPLSDNTVRRTHCSCILVVWGEGIGGSCFPPIPLYVSQSDRQTVRCVGAATYISGESAELVREGGGGSSSLSSSPMSIYSACMHVCKRERDHLFG